MKFHALKRLSSQLATLQQTLSTIAMLKRMTKGGITIQTRGLFRKEMRSHLRTKRKFRHAKNHKAASRGQIVEAVSIRDRPSHVEGRVIPGHWEGDLILGANNSYITTVVERQSRFTMLVKVAGKDTNYVVSAITAQMIKLPEHLKQSLT